MKGAPMKTYSLELVLFSWLAYNILIEITSWFDKEEVELPPAVNEVVVDKWLSLW